MAAERQRGMADGLIAAAALVHTKIIATSRISRTAASRLSIPGARGAASFLCVGKRSLPAPTSDRTMRFASALVLARRATIPVFAETAGLHPPDIPMIGWLGFHTDTIARDGLWQGLRELGYVDGKNIAFEYRFPEGDDASFTEPAEELVRRQVELRDAQHLVWVFEAILHSRAEAVIIDSDAIMIPIDARIAEFALTNRVPLISPLREFADKGGLISYGPSLHKLWRHAATYVDKILKGDRPADLPTTFELIVNLNTAKALGLIVPSYILARADEVIE
jgi:hypothetical protein